MAVSKVLIEILSNVRCRVSDVPKIVLRQIDDALAMPVEGAFHTGATTASGGAWDGKRHFFDPEAGTFPRGLLAKVKELLFQAGLEHEIRDLREGVLPPPKVSRLKVDMLEGVRFENEYAYQLDVARAALEQECGILWLATNGGKTEVACAIMKVLRECVTLFMVGKKGLLHDARKRIAERLGIAIQDIGIIGDGRFSPQHITVATVQSLAKVLPRKAGTGHKPLPRAKQERIHKIKQYLRSVQLRFFDECHHTKSRSWYKVGQLCPAQFQYNLSGTPFGSGNGLMVEASSGPVIARVSNAELIERGVSARPVIVMTECAEPYIEHQTGMIYEDVYKEGIVTNTFRNNLIVEDILYLLRRGLPSLTLVRELWQGDLVSQMLRSHGVTHRFLHGQSHPSDIVESLSAYAEGRLKVLIGSSIFDEGETSASGLEGVSWMPKIRGLVVADAGKSPRATLQKVGRLLRRKRDGSNTAELYDYADCTHKWLARHALERLKIYEEEGFQVITREPGERLDPVRVAMRERLREQHVRRLVAVPSAA